MYTVTWDVSIELSQFIDLHLSVDDYLKVKLKLEYMHLVNSKAIFYSSKTS